jgi:hypothetical protein
MDATTAPTSDELAMLAATGLALRRALEREAIDG